MMMIMIIKATIKNEGDVIGFLEISSKALGMPGYILSHYDGSKDLPTLIQEAADAEPELDATGAAAQVAERPS